MHHAAIVKEKIKALNRQVRYIPAYSPQLNPIENIFSEIKVHYIKLKKDSDIKG
jgi:transposase